MCHAVVAAEVDFLEQPARNADSALAVVDSHCSVPGLVVRASVPTAAVAAVCARCWRERQELLVTVAADSHRQHA